MKTENRKHAKFYLDTILGIIGIISLVSLIFTAGFNHTGEELEILNLVNTVLIVGFILQELARWFFVRNFREHFRSRWITNLLAILLILRFVFPHPIIGFLSSIFPQFTVRQITLIYLAIIQGSIIFVITVKVLRHNYLISKIHLNPGAIFTLSFAIMIIIGTLLLLLPKATPPGQSLSFIDSLFTSTSAVCVTGLIVVDTATSFAPLGKIILLLLIQIGGLGVMTLTTFFAAFLAGGISIRFRIMMQDLLSQESIAEVAKILLKIFLFTIIIEAFGAAFLYKSLGGSFTDVNWPDVYSAVFHSVSAFCNAGFSIYSNGLMQNVVENNFYFSGIIMLLIVLGGLGFTVLSNLSSLKPRSVAKKKIRHQLHTQTKIVLVATAILIFGGALIIYFAEPFEFDRSMGFFEKVFHSLFMSVTTRTAGFNTIPIGGLAAPSMLIVIFLMWIGASPGSTGGGVKTTTISLAFMTFINLVRGREKVELFYREIHPDSIRKAFMVIFASLAMLCISTIALVWFEPGLNVMDLIFEAVSAIGTVGLSRGVTAELNDAAKTVIIILMFVGRIGVFTFFMSFFSPQKDSKYSLPKSSIMIG